MVVPRPVVFLDRDGVLNRAAVIDGKAYAPRKLDDFRLLPGTTQAVQALKKAGYFVAVVTNQPDIGNKLVDAATVEAMHDRLRTKTAVDAIYYCPHSQSAECACRKPRPGMLFAAQNDFNLDLRQGWMIGDRAGDITAGRTAGCRTIFINRHYRESPPDAPTATVSSLPAAVAFILQNVQGGRHYDE